MLQEKQDHTPFDQACIELRSLQQAVLATDITDSNGFTSIGRMYSTARSLRKQIEDSRKKAIEPARREIAKVNDLAKELTNILELIDVTATCKIEQYWSNKEDSERILGLDADATLTNEFVIAYKKTETIYEVEDAALIPEKYMKVDMDLIEKDISLGLTVPGIKTLNNTKILVRTR